MPEDDYFADGLTEEVTIALAKVQALRVTSRRSAAAVGTTSAGARVIAGQLRVRYLVEGSVRRAGGRLRVSALLIDASQDIHLWAGTYDGMIDDVFSIQEQVARKIVEALELRLTATEERHLSERAINNVPAYECYLRARHDMWRWHRDAIDRAVQLLRQALALIGDNARLYATLGLAHLQYREAGIDLSDQPLLEADACASKLFALYDHSASGWQLRGWIAYSRGYIQDAVRDLKIALDSGPDTTQTRCSYSVTAISSPDASLKRDLSWHGCWQWIRSLRSRGACRDLSRLWRGTLRRRSSHIGRCSRWIRQTRWRVYFSRGS